MKLKLLPKFVASLGILGVVLTVVISLFSYNNSKTYLEEMYAHRVVSGSKMVADMLDVEDVKAIIAPGGDKTDAYVRICTLFDKLKVDGDITYLSLAVPDEDSVTFYVDSCVPEMGDDPANQIPYGTDIKYIDASSSEEEYQKYLRTYELFAENKGVDEPVVTDNEYGYNYSVAAVVLDENGKAIAEVQYNLDMGDVRAYLNSYLRNMFLISAVIVLISMFIYILTVRRIVLKPIGELAEFTDDITKTRNFEDRRIELKTGDEIEDLGNSFNFMMEEMERYIDDLSRVTAEKQRIGAELDIATRIQASMLPTIFPAFPDREEFDIYATMDPAKEVGGDFYDFFMVDDDNLAIVVADVSGKGVPAALFMVIGKTLIKDHTEKDKDLGEVFSEINNLLCESNSEELFITAFEAVLNLKTGELRYVNAGHEMPFIYKKNEEFKPYKIKPGFVLAGMEDMRYRSGVMTLEPGDKIFQYTDGVTEATDSDSKLFGMERLEASLNKVKDKDVTDILKSVKKDIDEFVNVAPQFDDITMLCLEYKQYKK